MNVGEGPGKGALLSVVDLSLTGLDLSCSCDNNWLSKNIFQFWHKLLVSSSHNLKAGIRNIYENALSSSFALQLQFLDNYFLDKQVG